MVIFSIIKIDNPGSMDATSHPPVRQGSSLHLLVHARASYLDCTAYAYRTHLLRSPTFQKDRHYNNSLLAGRQSICDGASQPAFQIEPTRRTYPMPLYISYATLFPARTYRSTNQASLASDPCSSCPVSLLASPCLRQAGATVSTVMCPCHGV